MQQINNYADPRLISGCIYCGGVENTREHIPSKILLKKPFPTNLPVMPACKKCNNSFSLDEEYLACIISCMQFKTTDPEKIGNERASNILKHKVKLRAQIENTKFIKDGQLNYQVDIKRLSKVIQKLALGHAAFELSIVLQEDPLEINWWYLPDMSDEEQEDFNSPGCIDLLGEIGSRQSQRIYILQTTLINPSTGETQEINIIVNDWMEVQEGQYRFHVSHTNRKINVKIVLSEFLACKVVWEY